MFPQHSCLNGIFVCVRYPNLDFGWKRSIDSKTYISCQDSCNEDGEGVCKHQESPDPSSPTHPSSHQSLSSEQGPLAALEPIEATFTRNLINGTALVDCDDNCCQVEHLYQYDGCKLSQPNTHGVQNLESIQTATSVPVQPFHSLKKPSFCPSQPSDECTTGGTSDHINKATSVCSWVTTGPSVSAAPSPDLGCVPQHRAQPVASPKSLGPNPGLILQALTLSNASDGFNLERLEMLGDSFLKHAITTYLFCTYPDAHEGRLSYMRSKKVRDGHDVSF